MSIELAIILFGISLAINIFLGFFAIFYPVRTSNRDFNKIKESQKDIEKITEVNLKVSEFIQSDLQKIQNKLLDKIMVIPELEPKEKKIVGTTISNAFGELIPPIIPLGKLGKDQLEMGELTPGNKLVTLDEIKKKYTKKKKDK